MLSSEKHNQERIKVKIPPQALYDQGSMAAPKLKGLRTGDSIMLENALHGKVLVKVPERAQLDELNFELLVDRLKGRPAYLAADDLRSARVSVGVFCHASGSLLTLPHTSLLTTSGMLAY